MNTSTIESSELGIDPGKPDSRPHYGDNSPSPPLARRTADPNAAAMLYNDSANHPQAEPRASLGFCREEGLENSGDMFLGYTAASVAEREAHTFFIVISPVAGSPRRDCQSAVLGYGLQCVEQQVIYRLTNFVLEAHD